MRKLLRIGAISFCLLLALAGIGFFAVWWSAAHVPDFYEKALSAEPQRMAVAGDKLEENILDLRNSSLQEGQWRAVFTDEQINGWLAVDMPQKFAGALPPQLKDPRVAIEPDVAYAAARYESPQMTAVISLAVEVRLTDEPNELAIRVRQARAGLLPVPLSDWLDQVSAAAAESGIPLRWIEEEGDPVAIVSIPLEDTENPGHILRLRQIELRAGELIVVGVTEDGANQTPRIEEGAGELRYSRSNQAIQR
jgi:hypothetical protein